VRQVIHNHNTANLSELDMRMVRAVPEGGNWKDIPTSIPSRRLDQIRESYQRGEGSRSTYYGRLRRDRPSYTINTYFNRPGNGCHIHYEQDRVLSQREAARLQSFPDAFEFHGPQGSINNQIGNAVPPLLAFQIANSLGVTGAYVDLFSGAGGLGLGFKWAGWEPTVANDIEPRFLETYRANVHGNAVVGSLAEAEVFERLVAICKEAKKEDEPFWVLGGPPCQGFSTAGNKRTREDPRNQLVWSYIRLLEAVQPDGFVFENVTGLLNMKQGRVYAEVCKAFSEVMPVVKGQVLTASEYGVPQRRKRVILVGTRDPEKPAWAPPEAITRSDPRPELFECAPPTVSVEEALSDLPRLEAGEKGAGKSYRGSAKNIYQALMRGEVGPRQYLEMFKEDQRIWPPDQQAT